jgi:hypothetical protein
VSGALALAALAVAAIEWMRAPLAAAALLLAIASAVVFVRAERFKGSRALVPLDLFAAPEFRGSIVATLGMTFGMYGTIFLVPLFWQSSGALGAIGLTHSARGASLPDTPDFACICQTRRRAAECSQRCNRAPCHLGRVWSPTTSPRRPPSLRSRDTGLRRPTVRFDQRRSYR